MAGSAGAAWLWLAAVALLVVAVDFALALGGEPRPADPRRSEAELDARVDVRTKLARAAAAADAGHPTFVLVGDSVLAGEVMAESAPDWASQRVLDHARAELGTDSDAQLEQVAFNGLLPIDALHVLAELDRIDPAGEVGFVLELNLRYFSPSYAELDDCTRTELCALARGSLGDGEIGVDGLAPTLARMYLGVRETMSLVVGRLRRYAPIRRHQAELDALDLVAIDGLAVTRARPVGSTDDAAARAQARIEGLARIQTHYRDASLGQAHAQVRALEQIVARLRARDRASALFLTPLEDRFVEQTLTSNQLGQRQAELAALIHARPSNIRLLDLDHPLFGPDLFLDHVHLTPDGNRLLALNLLHELGLPLRERPFDWMMVHAEDHDRTLVHRRATGFSDGGATQALFEAEGVAVSRTGDWIVIADTNNHVLRQLRGSMQIVERLAGQPKRAGSTDGVADEAQLERPRSPELVGDAVYFLDGEAGERVRELEFGAVVTLSWRGPSCDGYDELEAQARALYLLCDDDRVLALDLDTRSAALVFDPTAPGGPVGLRGLEPTDDGRLLLVDARSRIWALSLSEPDREPSLVFDNAAPELLPSDSNYPFTFAEMRLDRVVGMEWVERYGALLIQDEHELGIRSARLRREETERIHLRLLDLDDQRIYPWIKAIPHAEAFHMWNQSSANLVSYYHLGAMAIVQADASLVYVERDRSRVFRIADGLLAAAKAGGVNTSASKLALSQPIDTATADSISAELRPDRFLTRRHEPIPRAGPYVALLVGSSLSSLSDRFANYSLGRLLELELQAELGYRDQIRLDLYQRTQPTASLATNVDVFERWLAAAGPRPDVVMFELFDANPDVDVLDQLARVDQLAARYDTLVVFYDNSAMFADARDGLRASSRELRAVIEQIRAYGFVVLEPSDPLLRELLVESPWGNQPWDVGLHHGTPWAVELTAKSLASMAYPMLREFLRDRTPAREREHQEVE